MHFSEEIQETQQAKNFQGLCECGDDSLYQVSEEVEKVMWDEKKLFLIQFFHASAYFSQFLQNSLLQSLLCHE